MRKALPILLLLAVIAGPTTHRALAALDVNKKATIADLREEQKRLEELKRDLAYLVVDGATRASGANEFTVESLLGDNTVRDSFIVRIANKIVEPRNVTASASTGVDGEKVYSLKCTPGMVSDALVALARVSGRKLLIDKGISTDRISERVAVNLVDKRLDELLDLVLGLVELEHTLDLKYLTVVLPKRKGFASRSDYLEAKAVESYTRSLMHDPDSKLAAEAYRDLAEISRRRGRYAAALEQCETLTRKHPGTPEAAQARFRMGQIRLSLEDNENARRDLVRFIDLDPSDPRVPEAQLLIGHAFAGQKRHDEALRWYRQSINGGNAAVGEDALTGMGRVLFEKGSYNDALIILSQLIKKFPRSKNVPEALLRQAGALIRLKKPERAQNTLRFLLSRYSDSGISMEAYFLLADSLYRSGKKIEAIEAYCGALDRFPDSDEVPDAKLRLARLYNTLGMYASARQILGGLAARPDAGADRIEALKLLAEADLHLGNLTRAQQSHTTIAGETTGDKSHRASLTAAQLAIKRGRHRTALEMLDELIADQPADDTARGAYRAAAKCYIALDRPLKALAIYMGKPNDDDDDIPEKNEAPEGAAGQ